MMAGLTIRKAGKGDLPGIVKMSRKLLLHIINLEKERSRNKFFSLDEEKADKAWRSYHAKNITDKKALFLVAFDGKKPVGMALGKIVKLPPVFKQKEKGFIHELFVEEAYRDRKIGKAFIQRMEKFFKEKGVKTSQIKAESFNTEALAKYKHLGYNDFRVELIKAL